MSQLVERIDAELSRTKDSFAAAELMARKAAYFARTGAFAAAKQIIAEVRVTFGDGRSGRVTCLLLVAEGLALYYESLDERSLDKLARALLLSEAMRDTQISAVASVWKGFLEFEFSRFESMGRSLRAAHDYAEPSDHEVRCRLNLTCMLCAQLLGDHAATRSHFNKAHTHAVSAGDQACIDALLFNRAAFGFARQRVQWCRGQVDSMQMKAIKAELESAKNLQQMVGIAALSEHADFCLARSLTVEGDFARAIERLESFRDVDGFAKKHINALALEIEIAFCRLRDGTLSLIPAIIKNASVEHLAGLDPDERVAALYMWKVLGESSVELGNALEMAQHLSAAWADFDEYEGRLGQAATPLLRI